jgi:hypothetical protein
VATRIEHPFMQLIKVNEFMDTLDVALELPSRMSRTRFFQG